MLWSRKVRQLTISFCDLARSKLWDGWRVGSVTGQSAPGVYLHNAYSCPSQTFINGRRNSNASPWMKLLLDSSVFLSQGSWCMWTKVVMEGQVLSLKTFLFARGNHWYPWILHVWLRCIVCLLSALLYLYRTESAWKTIPGYPLKDDGCLEL